MRLQTLIASAAALLMVACAAAAPAPPPVPERAPLLIVANKQEASASVIDLASGRTLATLPTREGPHEAAVSHDGRWAVVTDYGAQTPGRSLTVIDLDALAVARTIDLGEHRRPHGVLFLPGDTLLAVTAEANQAVLLVDFRTGGVTAVPSGAQGTHMIAAPRDGQTLYTANVGAGTVTAIDVATRQTRSAPVAPVTEGIAVLPDGSQVWVGSNQQHTVTVLDARTLAPLDTFAAPGLPYRLSTDAAGRRVVVTNPMAGSVRIFDAVSRQELAAVAMGAGSQPVGSVVSPDGRRAYVTLQGTNEAAEVDLETFRVLRRFATGAGPDGIALRP